ncbi:hypothetical protein U1701_18170 [Sphingomonas sp. PB2P19]|uniref:hypothetical protein n=1 Tax=Sphingomonas rhamnosi TaxID=3096156 RepID=UPI002FC63358
MTEVMRLTERAIWQTAGEIVEQYGAGAADYIISQLGDVIEHRAAAEDWRRIAAAVDAIMGTKRQSAN